MRCAYASVDVDETTPLHHAPLCLPKESHCASQWNLPSLRLAGTMRKMTRGTMWRATTCATPRRRPCERPPPSGHRVFPRRVVVLHPLDRTPFDPGQLRFLGSQPPLLQTTRGTRREGRAARSVVVHTVIVVVTTRGWLLRLVGDDGFGREEQRRNGRCVLQR